MNKQNGRGRTGVAIAAYLLYKRVVTDADESLKYFNRKRSVVGEGVTIPSQKRYYAHYFYFIKLNNFVLDM